MQKRLKNERIMGYDILRLLAVFYVVILHINGHSVELHSLTTYSIGSRAVYYISQAVAYPAIHLFVLIGSYLMIERGVSLKQMLRIWFTTIIVSLSGLIVMVIVNFDGITLMGLIRCIFPFLGRAYWFVSDYIVLMLLAPFLNRLINSISAKALILLTAVFCTVNLILPTFLKIFSWSYGDGVFLFICLYLIAACFYRSKPNLYSSAKFLLSYIVSIALLIISVYAIIFSSQFVKYLDGKELAFYSYYSVFVIGAAISLFGLFSSSNVKNLKLSNFFVKISKYSLIVYLLHEHPIIKQFYKEWNVLGFMNTQTWYVYIIQVIGTCLVVCVASWIIGYSIVKVADYLSSKISVLLSQNKFIKKYVVLL